MGPELSPGQVVYALVDGRSQCVACSWRESTGEAPGQSAYPRALLHWPPIPTSAACRASRRLLDAGSGRWLHPAEVERLVSIAESRVLGVCSYCDPVLFAALRQRHWRLLRLALARGALPTPEDLRLEQGIPPSAAAELILKAAEAVAGPGRTVGASCGAERAPDDERLAPAGEQRSIEPLHHHRQHHQHRRGLTETAPLSVPTTHLEWSSFPMATLSWHSAQQEWQRRKESGPFPHARPLMDGSEPETAPSTPRMDGSQSLGRDESPRSIPSPDLALCPCGARATRSLLPIFHVALSRYGDKELHRLLRGYPLPDHMLREIRSWIGSLESGVIVAPTLQLHVSNACGHCFELLRQMLCLSVDSLAALPADLLQQPRFQSWPPSTLQTAPNLIQRHQSVESIHWGPGSSDTPAASPPMQFASAVPTGTIGAMKSSMRLAPRRQTQAALEPQSHSRNERGSPMVIRMRCGSIQKNYRIWSERPLRRVFRRFLQLELRLDPSRSVVRYRRWDARYVDRLPPIVTDYTRHPHCREVFDWDTPANLRLQDHDHIDCEVLEAIPIEPEAPNEINPERQ